MDGAKSDWRASCLNPCGNAKSKLSWQLIGTQASLICVSMPIIRKSERRQSGLPPLRMEDLREVLPMLAERLRFEDQLIEAEANARKSKNPKVANS
jgi:hypothetical protein